MQNLLFEYYNWLLAFHVISLIAWMAGIFYLPRLFVYHAEQAVAGSDISELFKVMELKLYRLIMNPAMIATWVFGVLMLWANGIEWLAASYWMHAKLLLISLMTGFHFWLGQRRKEFDRDTNSRTGRHYRLWNEAPTLLLVGIVILAIVKPF